MSSNEDGRKENMTKTLTSQVVIVLITVILWTVMSKLFDTSPIFNNESTLWIILTISISVFVMSILYLSRKDKKQRKRDRS